MLADAVEYLISFMKDFKIGIKNGLVIGIA